MLTLGYRSALRADKIRPQLLYSVLSRLSSRSRARKLFETITLIAARSKLRK